VVAAAPPDAVSYVDSDVKTRHLLFTLVLLAAAAAPAIHAATSGGTVGVTVTIAAIAKLSLSTSTLTFPNADPDTTPLIPAAGGALTVTAKAKTATGATVSLTVIAGGDLMSGTDTIPASSVSWTATGAGFVAGTMSRVTAQSVAAWVGSGSRVGTQSYGLANSWSYPTGVFSATATYTLTAP